MNATELSKKISQEKFVIAYQTILEMIESGESISFITVSEKAKVSRQFLYHHSELRALICEMRITIRTKQELQQEILRLRLRVRELEALLESDERKPPIGFEPKQPNSVNKKEKERC